MSEQGSSFLPAPTEQDIRLACEQAKVSYALVYGMFRNLTQGKPGIGAGDCLFVMALAMQNGLPPVGPWYAIIPRRDGDRDAGYSICVRIEAADYVISNHPKMEGRTVDWYWTIGNQLHTRKDPPQFPPPRKDGDKWVSQVNPDMKCTVVGRLKGADKDVELTYTFRECSKSSHPVSPWMVQPAHMLAKQVRKMWAKIFLGCSLPFEDEGTLQMVAESNGTYSAPEAAPPATRRPPVAAAAAPAEPTDVKALVVSAGKKAAVEGPTVEVRAEPQPPAADSCGDNISTALVGPSPLPPGAAEEAAAVGVTPEEVKKEGEAQKKRRKRKKSDEPAPKPEVAVGPAGSPPPSTSSLLEF